MEKVLNVAPGDQRAIFTASAIGNTAAIAAVAGQVIRVKAIVISAVTANNVKFQSNTTDVTGLHYLGATATVVLPYSPGGWFETAAGEALNVNLSAATAVQGEIIYEVI